MGIVNRTPDSFFDQGRTYALDRAVDAALAAAQAGAGWVDIGGVPFSPDTPEVSAAEELDRVLPVVTAVAMASDVVISVDTFRPEVADACLAAGAAVVNDTSGLRDPELAAVVAARGATIVITHSLAAPRQHLRRPEYGDVVAEVRAFLAERAAYAVSQGIGGEPDRPRSRPRPEQEHPAQPGADPAADRDRRPRAAAAGGGVQQGLRRRGDRAGQAGPDAAVARRGHRLRPRRGPDPADARRRRRGRRRPG